MKLLSYGLTLQKVGILSRITSDQIFYNSVNNKYPHLHFLNNLSYVRQIQTSNGNRSPRTPDLIYVPHILRWIKTKLRFKVLQKVWDPEFSEGAFIYGTIRAICKITEVINEDMPEELDGLLTETARLRLQKDMSSRLTAIQKKIIKLKPDEIKILVPTSISFKTTDRLKQCNVSLRSLALKWHEDRGSLKLVLVALQAEFMRDYGEGKDSQWIISLFDVLECAFLRQSNAAH